MRARPGLLAATAAWGDRVGNPTLFSAELIPQLLDLTGDRGGRAVLEACGERCQRIQVDTPRELEDVDTRQALEENGQKPEHVPSTAKERKKKHACNLRARLEAED